MLNVAVVLADAMMIFSLLRTPTSYFRPYRKYFVTIYVAFIAFPTRELALFFNPNETLLQTLSQSMVVAGVVIAILWGHLATRLYLHPEAFRIKSIVTDPRRPAHSAFILYLVPMAVTLTSSLFLPESFDTDPGNLVVYPLSQVTYRAVEFLPEFLAIASSIMVAFVVYPFSVLVRLRSQLKDSEVRHALKVIASCFGAVAALLVTVNGITFLGVSVIAPGHMVSAILLIVVVRAFSRPSFLKAFLGVVPSLETFSSTRMSDQTVLIYRSEDEKFGPISRYVSEGLGQLGRVVYFFRGDETLVLDGLSRHGFNVRQHVTRGTFRLVPFSSLYQSEGLMEEEAALDYCRQLADETRELEKESLTVIVDYGDRTKRPSQKFVEHLADTRWTTSDHYVKVLMTFDSTAFQGQENALTLLRSKLPVLDLSETIDLFSRTVGLSHSAITGKKILLEYDPLSDYDKVLRTLVAEAASNLERTVMFTRKDSPAHSHINQAPRVKVFTLTPKVSYPRIEAENRILLPAYDTSLLLDALSKTIEAFSGVSFLVIFDSISHYIFTLGPERAESLVRQSLELMISDKITAFFLLNLGAHEQKTLSMFENLFDVEMVCRSGARVPEVRQKLSLPA